jgi:hypothetical protein
VLADLQVGAPIWIHWIRIAKAQTALARAGADTAPPPATTIAEILAAAEEPVRGTMTDEMYPAMIAITAVTSVLDGLYDQLAPFAPPVAGPAKRHRRILERLKLCFSVGSESHEWLAEFDWLYALRDRQLHPEHKAWRVVAHPSGWPNVPALYADYSADNAEKALALLEDILRACIAHPKAAARQWAEGTGKGALAELSS